jgi:hypothetical protein
MESKARFEPSGHAYSFIVAHCACFVFDGPKSLSQHEVMPMLGMALSC